MYTGKLGVAVISFDRPQYLGRLLASLEENTYLEDTDFHFFQDGAVNRFSGRQAAHPARIRQAVACAGRARLPNKHDHIRDDNVSIAIHQFEAYEWMAAHYEALLVLEDDIVVSPHYLRVMRVLLDSIAGCNRVFSASSNFVKEVPGDFHRHLATMLVVHRHWWGEAFRAAAWQQIRPAFLDYYDLVREIDYVARPHDAIRRLFARHGFVNAATSQDGGKDMAVFRAGLLRVRLTVNRAVYIGQRGLHCTPALYRQAGWGTQEPYIFPEDQTIDRFHLRHGLD